MVNNLMVQVTSPSTHPEDTNINITTKIDRLFLNVQEFPEVWVYRSFPWTKKLDVSEGYDVVLKSQNYTE